MNIITAFEKSLNRFRIEYPDLEPAMILVSSDIHIRCEAAYQRLNPYDVEFRRKKSLKWFLTFEGKRIIEIKELEPETIRPSTVCEKKAGLIRKQGLKVAHV